MRFSIIVPIYNVEKYLVENIDSVLNQNYSDYELILVDDGSPDDCAKICDEYAKKDTRIRVIHKSNGGLSSARNEGIKIAKGEYIVFLDSDDLMCEDALRKISNALTEANQPDIIIGNIVHYDGKDSWIVVDNKKYINEKIDTIFHFCQLYAKDSVQLPWRAYQTVYRRELLIKNNLTYDEEITGAEDCDFFVKLLHFVETYSVSDINLVKYRIEREGSIITSPSYKSVLGQLIVFARAFRDVSGYSNQNLMRTYFAERYTNIIILIGKLNDSSKKDNCFQFVKDNKDILLYARRYKYVFARGVWKLFGFSRGTNLLLKMNSIMRK